MRAGNRQQLGGLIVNQRANVPRRDYDNLRATLNNAVHHGPASQNREQRSDYRAQLQGRIAWVASANLKRGERIVGSEIRNGFTG